MWSIADIAARCVLCVAVFVSSSHVAMRHSHALGEWCHTHSGQGEAKVYFEHDENECSDQGRRQRGHTHPHSHPHAEESSEPADTLVPTTSHIHVWLLGFEFTFPVEPSPQGDQEGQRESLISLAEREFVPPVTAPQLDDGSFNAWTPVIIVRTGDKLMIASVHRHRDGPFSQLLCDSARHERSGVQLI